MRLSGKPTIANQTGDRRDFNVMEFRERFKRMAPEQGTSAGMTAVQGWTRKVKYVHTHEDELEPGAVY
jgi:hypothetical protein